MKLLIISLKRLWNIWKRKRSSYQKNLQL